MTSPKTTSPEQHRVLPNEVGAALGPVRSVEFDLRSLAHAFSVTGNTNVAEQLRGLADVLGAAEEQVKEIADWHFNDYLRLCDQSSKNMLGAAFAVARHFAPKQPTVGDGEVPR